MARKKRKVTKTKKRAIRVSKSKTKKPRSHRRTSRKLPRTQRRLGKPAPPNNGAASRTRTTGQRLRITTTRNTTLNIYREKTSFAHSAYFRKERGRRQRGQKAYVKKLPDRFLRFYKKHRGKGDRYGVKLAVSINIRGKRVKQFISLKTRIIRSKKGAEQYYRGLTDELQKLLRRYTVRKDFQSVTIKGMELEVKTFEVPIKPNNRKKSAKKSTVSRLGH